MEKEKYNIHYYPDGNASITAIHKRIDLNQDYKLIGQDRLASMEIIEKINDLINQAFEQYAPITEKPFVLIKRKRS